MQWDETSPARVAGRVVIGRHHLQPYGIVHGGVWASIAESAASIGAHLAATARDPSAGAVGLENHTTFLRAVGEGAEVEFEAKPLFAGRRAQAWEPTAQTRQPAVGRQGRRRRSAGAASPAPPLNLMVKVSRSM